MVRANKTLQCAAVLVACGALAGCSAETEEEPVIANALKLSFSPMYSAFDGVRDYQLPVTLEAAAYDPKGTDPVDLDSVRWTVDKKFATQQEYPELPAGVLLTTKSAGKTIVTAEGRSKSGRRLQGTAVLNISKADPAEWELGEARYNDQVPLMPSDPAEQEALANMGLVPINRDASCANCHNSNGNGGGLVSPELGGVSIEHTPQQTAGYTDEDLIRIFTMGAKPMGAKLHSPIFMGIPEFYAEMYYKMLHTWNIAPEVERGIVYKLRSLTPKTQEEIDFERILREAQAQDAAESEAAAAQAGAGM